MLAVLFETEILQAGFDDVGAIDSCFDETWLVREAKRMLDLLCGWLQMIGRYAVGILVGHGSITF